MRAHVAGASYRGWRSTGLIPLIISAHIISLRCKHEQSASDSGDLGFERQPPRSGKSNDSKSRAGTDHPRAYDRVGDRVLTVIRRTTNNPGGSPVHCGIVHYGTSPSRLIETAKSPIRLNPGHSSTVFRVRLDDLKARTIYHFRVDSMGANGERDSVTSPIGRFTTR